MLNAYYGYFVPSTVLIPIVLGFINFNKLTNSYRILLYFLILSGCTDLLLSILSALAVNSMFILHIYTIAEFLILSQFYKQQFTDSPSGQKTILIAQIIFIVICVINTVFFEDIWQYDAYACSLEAVIIIVMAVVLINKKSQVLDSRPWKEVPLNWFNTGLILYFSGSLFMFMSTNYVMHVPKLTYQIIYALHSTALLIMYILFAIGFNKCRQEALLNTSSNQADILTN